MHEGVPTRYLIMFFAKNLFGSTPSTLERMEEKNYFCTHIYHRDHNERLIRAIYVGIIKNIHFRNCV